MVQENRWRRFQERLGYSDQELEAFRANPKWVKMVEEARGFMRHKIVAEVIQARGCFAQHKVGDRIVMDANGILLTEECPPRMCLYLVAPLSRTCAALWERLAENLDPDDLCFKHVGCYDVGLECGGWGRVLMRVHVEEMKRS